MDGQIVTERLEGFARKRRVDAFGLLQAHDVRPTVRQPFHHVVDPLLDRIDVPAGNAHGRGPSGVQSEIAVEWAVSSASESSVHAFSAAAAAPRSEEHTSELQSRENLVCRLL